MGVYLEDLTYKEILPILARTGKLIDTRKIIEIDLVKCGECKWQRVNKKNGLYGCGHRFGLIKADDDNFCPYGERRNR